jgi:hypothetical protein
MAHRDIRPLLLACPNRMSSMTIKPDISKGLFVLYLLALRSPAKWCGLWAALGWTCSLPLTSPPPGRPASMSAPQAGRAASLCTRTGYVSSVLEQSSQAVQFKGLLLGHNWFYFGSKSVPVGIRYVLYPWICPRMPDSLGVSVTTTST